MLSASVKQWTLFVILSKMGSGRILSENHSSEPLMVRRSNRDIAHHDVFQSFLPHQCSNSLLHLFVICADDTATGRAIMRHGLSASADRDSPYRFDIRSLRPCAKVFGIAPVSSDPRWIGDRFCGSSSRHRARLWISLGLCVSRHYGFHRSHNHGLLRGCRRFSGEGQGSTREHPIRRDGSDEEHCREETDNKREDFSHRN